MPIDFSDLALSPNESRAARNYLGLSQAQTADRSSLPAHKLKRFETGNYVPDSQFLDELRAFFEGQGYNFHDENAPGAKAKARGDVFQAGVVGGTDGPVGGPISSTAEDPTGSPSGTPVKLPRPQTANLQFMRISPQLENEQVNRVFDCIEFNETALLKDAATGVTYGFLDSGAPAPQSQALAVAMLRRLAENGLLYARLMGRNLLPPVAGPVPAGPTGTASPASVRPSLFGTGSTPKAWKTIGDLLRAAMADVQLGALNGDQAAQARWKDEAPPTEVLQALVG